MLICDNVIFVLLSKLLILGQISVRIQSRISNINHSRNIHNPTAQSTDIIFVFRTQLDVEMYLCV